MSKVLFAFEPNPENCYCGWVNFWASSEEYWLAEGCFDDQFRDEHLGVDIPGVANTMEAAFELNPKFGATREEAKAYLESFGLVYSQEMQNALDGWL